MLMVVAIHIEGFSLFIEEFNITLLFRICESIMLPIFFFISGFVSKTINNKDLLIKSSQLLLPAIVLGISYSYYINKDIFSFVQNIYKYGYWFTITLCEMIIILYCIHKMFIRDKIIISSLIIIAVILYLSKILFNNNLFLDKIGDIFCLHQLFIYFPYFALGFILSKKKTLLNKCLLNEFCIIVSIIVFFVALCIKYYYSDEYLATSIALRVYRFIQDPILGVTGIYILLRFFSLNQDLLSKTKFGQLLSLIGRHTFEIYLLHYFILPKMPYIGNYLFNYPNIIIELLIVLILSIVVICISLIISKFIRTNSILSFILLGNKPSFFYKSKN